MSASSTSYSTPKYLSTTYLPDPSTHPELVQIHAHAIDLARQAGAYLRKENARWRNAMGQMRESEEKGGNSVDLVTESDKEVERMIREGVLERYPNHKVRM